MNSHIEPDAGEPPRPRRPLRQAALLLFYGAVAVICFLAIRSALQPGGFGAIGPAFLSIRPIGLALSALSVAGFFAALWVLEQCALRDVGAPSRARGLLIAPLAANALSIGVGFGALSGSALRMRLYAGAQLAGSAAIYVASSVTIMCVLGGCLIAALGCVFGQLRLPSLPAGFMTAAPWIGGMMLAGLAALVFLAGPGGRRITLLATHFDLPSSRGLSLQISIGALSWLCSVLALYVLLPPVARPPFAEFTTSFVVFELIALTTGAPGGLGVFEAMILSLANGQAPPERMAAALICYRMISFVAPVVLGFAAGAALITLKRPRRTPER